MRWKIIEWTLKILDFVIKVLRRSPFTWDEPEFTKGGERIETKLGMQSVKKNEILHLGKSCKECFLVFTNIFWASFVSCCSWSDRFRGLSHLQELHCENPGWVSILVQCEFFFTKYWTVIMFPNTLHGEYHYIKGRLKVYILCCV